jgi:hypothetical protein
MCWNGSAKAHVRSAHAGCPCRLGWIPNETLCAGLAVRWVAVSQADLDGIEFRMGRSRWCRLESESAVHYVADRELGNRLPLLFICV